MSAAALVWHPDHPWTFVAGTGNRNKLSELKAAAERYGLRLLSPSDARRILSLDPWPEVEELEPSYRGNALLKARAFAGWSGLPAIGDDSGLEVTVLDGRPGVHSARYAGPGASDSDRIAKLLDEVRSVESAAVGRADRSARFRCCLIVVDRAGSVFESEGVLTGEILDSPQGTGGFGYDPIVRLDELGKTLAEIDHVVTCERGFRALAADRMFGVVLGFSRSAPRT